MGFEIDPHAAYAGRLHVGERAGAYRVVDHGDAARLRAEPAQRVERARIVGAVGARLHDDRALDLQGAVQRLQVLDRGIAGRVTARIGKRIAAGRSENVHVTIAGAARHRESGRCMQHAKN